MSQIAETIDDFARKMNSEIALLHADEAETLRDKIAYARLALDRFDRALQYIQYQETAT